MLEAKCISFTPDNKQLVIGDYDGYIHLWNWNEGEPQFATSLAAHQDWVIRAAHPSPIESIAVTRNGLIVSGDWNGDIQIRSLRSPQRILQRWNLSRVWSMALHPDHQHVAVGCGTGLTYILKLPPIAQVHMTTVIELKVTTPFWCSCFERLVPWP